MIVQACLNGARKKGYHPRLPISAQEIALDGLACVEAGAAELHVHARRDDGRESLAEVDRVIGEMRTACPGTLIGVSTGTWIEGNEQRTREAISAWRALPDYASVNLSEPDAPAVIDLLRGRGVGVEAGLATVEDAERLITLNEPWRVLRVLIEISEQDVTDALEVTKAIAEVLDKGALRRPILLHGFDATVWPLVRRARECRWSTRVGLEDGDRLPDGKLTPDNASLVSAAVAIFGRLPTGGRSG